MGEIRCLEDVGGGWEMGGLCTFGRAMAAMKTPNQGNFSHH